MTHNQSDNIENVPLTAGSNLPKLGLSPARADRIVALAGNPNTGKSTIFNALTGLRQHTGNWPGKTIARAEGIFALRGQKYRIMDLPGTYSLLSATDDEEVARDFILFGRPDVTIVVVDAMRLERNLNLVLQILQITDRIIVCVNLIDEAEAHGVAIDEHGLARDLGVPVVLTAARNGRGIDRLLQELDAMVNARTACTPRRLKYEVPGLREAINRLAAAIAETDPLVPHREWIAMRLLESDARIIAAVASGEIGSLNADHATTTG